MRDGYQQNGIVPSTFASGTRVNSTTRIISPTSSCNNYPHLKADNSVFNGAHAKKNSAYGGLSQANQPVIPTSYGPGNDAL